MAVIKKLLSSFMNSSNKFPIWESDLSSFGTFRIDGSVLRLIRGLLSLIKSYTLSDNFFSCPVPSVFNMNWILGAF